MPSWTDGTVPVVSAGLLLKDSRRSLTRGAAGLHALVPVCILLLNAVSRGTAVGIKDPFGKTRFINVPNWTPVMSLGILHYD